MGTGENFTDFTYDELHIIGILRESQLQPETVPRFLKGLYAVSSTNEILFDYEEAGGSVKVTFSVDREGLEELIRGESTFLPFEEPFPAKENHSCYIKEETVDVEYLSLDEITRRFNRFVDDNRRRGDEQYRKGNKDGAQQYWERASIISQRAEDYARLLLLDNLGQEREAWLNEWISGQGYHPVSLVQEIREKLLLEEPHNDIGI